MNDVIYTTMNSLVRSSLLLDIEILPDLGVNTAFSLGGAVFVDEILESARSLSTISEPDLVIDLLRRMHVSQ